MNQISGIRACVFDAYGTIFDLASAFGMRAVWCNRYGQHRERLPSAPDQEIRSLAELPALLAPPG